ncbi:LysR family transcriptional regulator [Sneathiella sp.]|jgi:DNA-binding transcriptional LysR family regulator|uniref:LysR family transcriptional regulator n=1 Tax=Sneathiella sp. TaxID=1964365 RepID=UPI0039E23579
MQNISLQALEIFRTVAAEGSVSKAAQKLGRVQSNISTRIKQLEENLGKSLFLRKNRGLDLTSDGKLLLSYAERFHSLSEETTEAFREGKPSGSFRIGAMESTAAARLPAFMSKYHALYPAIEIELVTGTAAALLTRLQKYEIEAAFIAEPLTDPTLDSLSVFEEQLVLIAPTNYPSLEMGVDLNGRPLIAFEVGCAYRRYLERWLMDNEIFPSATHSLSSYLAILASVSAGSGFSVIPQSVLSRVQLDGTFQTLPLDGEYAHIQTLLAWRRDFSSPRLDCLKALLI